MTTTFLFLVAALLLGALSFVSGQENRTYISVEYEYRLEVNTSSSQFGISAEDELTSWVSNIDMNIVPTLQKQLPNGKAKSEDELPNVKFESIDTQTMNQCYTKSDLCRWMKSTILVSYVGDKPGDSVQRVALRMVMEYMKRFNAENPSVRIDYSYPMIFSGMGQFTMRYVQRGMNDAEIEIFENAFHDVFAAIIEALDGDTEITESFFVYQALEEQKVDQEDLVAYVSTVDMKYHGMCRYCSKSDFTDVVNGVIEDATTLNAFRVHLIEQGFELNSSYFDGLVDITYSQPEYPDDLPPIEDESIYDSEASQPSTKYPWLLFLFIGVATAVIFIGLRLVCSVRRESTKEVFSTDDEDSYSYSEEQSDQSDGSSRDGTSRDSEDPEENTFTIVGYDENYGGTESCADETDAEEETADGSQSCDYETQADEKMDEGRQLYGYVTQESTIPTFDDTYPKMTGTMKADDPKAAQSMKSGALNERKPGLQPADLTRTNGVLIYEY
mmetsp:Transcript_5071/g.9437  ORF Transcript_5071/g.9437 Transcript_5071/m.9437 type:complete len:500 (+) Transcript_5071:46-1545(+)